MRKIWEGKKNNMPVVLWGDGSPLREFTFSNDIAKILVEILESNFSFQEPINIGNTGEYSIRDITKVICKIMEYDFEEIQWDNSKPSGQYRKPSCNKEFLYYFPKFKYTDLLTGLSETCKWFMETYPNVRGV